MPIGTRSLQMRILLLKFNRLRNKVYNDAEAAGKLGRGFYSMTAPTGTAKTLALMRFALEQAKVNGYKRIFVVLPYLSIISQMRTSIEKHLVITLFLKMTATQNIMKRRSEWLIVGTRRSLSQQV